MNNPQEQTFLQKMQTHNSSKIKPSKIILRFLKICIIVSAFLWTVVKIKSFKSKWLRKHRRFKIWIWILVFKKKKPHTIPFHLRSSFEKLSAAFLKLAQILSVREDLLPHSIIIELRKTQDKLPSFEFSQVVEMIREDFGKDIEEIFLELQESPIATASIAQVHIGHLLDGRKVVVKVQRPGIVEEFYCDLWIIDFLANVCNHIPSLKFYSVKRFTTEFENYTKDEINFLVEAKRSEMFRKLLNKQQSVGVPKIIKEYSSMRIITMEYLEGIKPESHDYLLSKGLTKYQLKSLARKGVKIVLQQLFVYGKFHGDPHPGNLLIVDKRKWFMLDFGITGTLNKETQLSMFFFYYYLVLEDFARASDYLVKMSDVQPYSDLRGFKKAAMQIGKLWIGSEFKEFNIGKLIFMLLQEAAKHGLRLPGDVFIAIKSIVTVEALGYILDPKFDLSDISKSIVVEIFFERISSLDSANLFRPFLLFIPEFIRFFKETPTKILSFYELIRDDGLQIGSPVLQESVKQQNGKGSPKTYSVLMSGMFMLFGFGFLLIPNFSHHFLFPSYYNFPVPSLVSFGVSLSFALKVLFFGK